jgi:hypothetical protein
MLYNHAQELTHKVVVVNFLCSQVDPIVASFAGGAVGVISALMVVELNNVKQQEHKRCTYCHGTGTAIGTFAHESFHLLDCEIVLSSRVTVLVSQHCPSCQRVN